MSEQERLIKAIAHLERQRPLLGDAVVETAVVVLREKIDSLDPFQTNTEQRKQVTILFADLVGFTAFAEKMDPEDVRDIVSTYFASVTPAIQKRGGRIEKFIGDAIMAVFGLPQASESDPENAIYAALEMQQALANLNESLERRYHLRLEMRIGINTGSVIASFLSEDQARDFAVVGDAVNTASRLEKLAPANGILVAHDTYVNVRGVFDVKVLAPINVKGKIMPLQVYLIHRAKPRAFRVPTRGVEGIHVPMIGREVELKTLQSILNEVIDQKSMRVVTIVGEAGLGKSRLVHEFENWYDLLPIWIRLFKGRANERMSRQPFAMLRDIFAFRFEIKDNDDPQTARTKLEEAFVEFLGEEGVGKAHFVGHLLGMDFANSAYLRGIKEDARQIYDRALHYLVQFFTAVSDQSIVAILLEDIHWADAESLSMIEHLIQQCSDTSILIVAIARPTLFEQRPFWGKLWVNHSQIQLNPLDRHESYYLVNEILRFVPDIPQTLQDTVVRNAEGNPFYVEELIKVMIEDDVIVKGDTVWTIQLDRLAAMRIPPTLTGVLQARLDRLSWMEQEVLQRASVVGPIFWDAAISFLGQGTGRILEEPLNIKQALQDLHQKELIYTRDTPTFTGIKEFAFKQTILHDVTYARVLRDRRRRYHHQVAEWLVRRSRKRAEEHAGLIATHYEQANEATTAAEWYGRAGQQAQDTNAYAAAVAFYQKALQLLPEQSRDYLPQYIRLHDGLGQVLRRQAKYQEALENFQAMLSAAKQADDPFEQAQALVNIGTLKEVQGEYRAALALTEQAETLIQSLDPIPLNWLARLQTQLAWMNIRVGESDLALTLAQKSLQLAEESDSELEMSRSLNVLGALYSLKGQYQEAMVYYEQSLLLDRKLGNRYNEAVKLNNMGEDARLQGDYLQAAALYLDALAIAKEVGDRDGEFVYLSNLGGAQVGLGDHEAAVATLQQVIETSGENGLILDETYQFLAQAHLALGHLQEALTAAQWSLAIADTAQHSETMGGAWRILGNIAAQLHQPIKIFHKEENLAYDARACYQESVTICQYNHMLRDQAWTLRSWARYEFSQGDEAQGITLWQKARTIFVALNLQSQVDAMDRQRPLPNSPAP